MENSSVGKDNAPAYNFPLIRFTAQGNSLLQKNRTSTFIDYASKGLKGICRIHANPLQQLTVDQL